MKTFRSSAHAIVLLAAGALTSPLSAQTFIDRFTSDPSLSDAVALYTDKSTVQTVSVSQFGLAGVLGGERISTLTRIGNVGAGSTNPTELYIDNEAGLGMNNATGTKSVVFLEYGKSEALKFDLSAFGAAGAFKLNGWNTDTGVVKLELILQSGVNTEIRSLNLSAASADPVFQFTEFTTINFAEIDQISLRFTGQNNGIDASAESLVVIPEPQAYALLSGLLVLALLRRCGRAATTAA